MPEMRRLWVDKVIFEDHYALNAWLAEQGLSRFYVEVDRTEHDVLIDVHVKSDDPIVPPSRSDPMASSRRCNDRDCPLCTTNSQPHLTEQFSPAKRYVQSIVTEEPFTRQESAIWTETDFSWYRPGKPDLESEAESAAYPERRGKPVKAEEKTDPMFRLKEPLSPAVVAVWAGSVLLALVAAFICVRLWYVKYGCPFWPDHGLLSACKTLTIKVGK